jgi:hypothetical protein
VPATATVGPTATAASPLVTLSPTTGSECHGDEHPHPYTKRHPQCHSTGSEWPSRHYQA